MSLLSADNLPEDICIPSYDRDAVTAGILHFGIGNFHRAHQAVYVDDLLKKGAQKWGIVGVSLRSSSMRDALKPQDYLYILAILGETTDYRVIGSIKDVLVAPADPQAVIDLLANPTTQLVNSTITEKGYYLASGTIDFEHPNLKAEIASLETPTTIYGFLTCGIIQRSQAPTPSKLTIMCCDNISAGGELIEYGVQNLLQIHDKEALAWSKNNVSFVSSMVDRVSPATNDALRDSVLRDTKRRDASPVSTEPFSQWIIEDNFAGERPEFDQVGAVFVENISPFEKMKLGYLNAAHTIASTLGYLNSDTYVHESLERPEVLNFMHQALYKNVLPNAAVPQGYDGATYIEDVIKRFQNSNLPYANLQVGTDSSQKIQQRWFPTIDQTLNQNAECSYFEFCIGAWVMFIQTALDNGVLNDPNKVRFQQVKTTNFDEVIKAYLTIANADQFEFYDEPDFMRAVSQHANKIKTDGLTSALVAFLNAQGKTDI